MSAVDQNYKKIIKEVNSFGVLRPNRTGVNTVAIPSAMFQHDMSEGFPILAGKKVSFRTMKVELIGFLLGITDKDWYQDKGCTIWDEWCTPDDIPESIRQAPKESREAYMKENRRLGPIYGHQWRAFNQRYPWDDHSGPCSDQIVSLLHDLEFNPDSRRMIVSAWNPLQTKSMALPPCHFSWQVLVIDGTLHLNWNQRSVDVFLGLPYNIAFYGLLLHCLAHQFGYKPGMLTGFLGDTHIYDNHLSQVYEYLDRPEPENNNPTIVIPNVNSFSILDEETMMKIRIKNYNPHPAIKADVAI
jgi:thymidylate synthase